MEKRPAPLRRLTGSVPGEFGALSCLTRFSLADNGVEGEVPKGSGGLADFRNAIIYGNEFSG